MDVFRVGGVFFYLVQSNETRAFADSLVFPFPVSVEPGSPSQKAPAGIPAGAAIDELELGKSEKSETAVVAPSSFYEKARTHSLSAGELLFIFVILCCAGWHYVRMRRTAAAREKMDK